MARMHILNGTGPNLYRVVMHEPVAGTGNNSAGIQWRTALVASGLGGKTVLSTGTSGWQVSAAEATQIANGEVYEVEFPFYANPAWTTAQRNSALDNEANKRGAEAQAELANALKWFGATR